VTGAPLRRVLAVLLAYAAGAWIVLLGARWLRRVLALPQLFDDLLLAALIAGVPVAAVVAWRYPDLGHTESAARRDER
jgi:uncharacterized membrane protein